MEAVIERQMGLKDVNFEEGNRGLSQSTKPPATNPYKSTQCNFHFTLYERALSVSFM
jgi:hypothetical protein